MNSDQEIQSRAFLPYMADVARCELSLHELNQMWRLIEASAKMNCPIKARLLLPAMIATRTGFAHLERSLVSDLVQEKVRQVLDEIGTKAQYAIDILVRNLFERTADVGFLATDVELCRFVAGIDGDQSARASACPPTAINTPSTMKSCCSISRAACWCRPIRPRLSHTAATPWSGRPSPPTGMSKPSAPPTCAPASRAR